MKVLTLGGLNIRLTEIKGEGRTLSGWSFFIVFQGVAR